MVHRARLVTEQRKVNAGCSEGTAGLNKGMAIPPRSSEQTILFASRLRCMHACVRGLRSWFCLAPRSGGECSVCCSAGARYDEPFCSCQSVRHRERFLAQRVCLHSTRHNSPSWRPSSSCGGGAACSDSEKGVRSTRTVSAAAIVPASPFDRTQWSPRRPFALRCGCEASLVRVRKFCCATCAHNCALLRARDAPR